MNNKGQVNYLWFFVFMIIFGFVSLKITAGMNGGILLKIINLVVVAVICYLFTRESD